MGNLADADFEFTNDWFGMTAGHIWRDIMPKVRPRHVLEVGSYEGRSACELIGMCDWSPTLSITCIDTWRGGEEHQGAGIDMRAVRERFDHNTALAAGRSAIKVSVTPIVQPSITALARMVGSDGGPPSFDFIYVDGSHQAKDVLADAVLAFRLLRPGGVIGFDDYLWRSSDNDILSSPKLAIDAFTTIYGRHIQVLNAPASQVYCQRIAG